MGPFWNIRMIRIYLSRVILLTALKFRIRTSQISSLLVKEAKKMTRRDVNSISFDYTFSEMDSEVWDDDAHY